MKNRSTKIFRDITACISPPPIPLINTGKLGVKKESNYVKVDLHRNNPRFS